MTTMVRLFDASTSMLGPDRVEAIAGTSKLARDGHIVEMKGMDTRAFMRSGTILWSHDPNVPVGTPAATRVDGDGNLRITIDFAPIGMSDRADEVRRLVKAGIIRNLSIGFDPIESKPLDPKNPRRGMHITRSELLEVSFVSVPADVGAVVTARAGIGPSRGGFFASLDARGQRFSTVSSVPAHVGAVVTSRAGIGPSRGGFFASLNARGQTFSTEPAYNKANRSAKLDHLTAEQRADFEERQRAVRRLSRVPWA